MTLLFAKGRSQSGSSLIEVLVSVLILSFGLLALGAMLSYSVLMPKLAAYRGTATFLASSHIERMRANPGGFDGTTNSNGGYVQAITYNATLPAITSCTYPLCDVSSITTLDKDASNQAIRASLPLGGMLVACNGVCSNREGDLWVMWQEPSVAAQLNPAANTSDECPDSTAAPGFAALRPAPRCLHIRFKL